MLRNSLLIVTLLALAVSCRQSPKKEVETEASPAETPAQTTPGEDASYSGETSTTRHFCFASKTPTPEEFGETYNYHFIRVEAWEDGRATGSTINAPYGTDGSRGSISGIYREGESLLQSTTTYLAEGEVIEEQRDYKIGKDAIAVLNADREAAFTVPAVSCEQYEAYLKEYQQGILHNRVNTTDRSRLMKVQEVADFGYSQEELQNLRFMELGLDLDNDYGTEEYLLYIMDPMVCGSGGCNLLVINGEGKTLSSTSVVKLPIYIPTSTIEGSRQKGTWKPLYVWSQGFRELDPKDGQYPSNASMAPEVSKETLTGHPEKYQLVLDYLE